MNQIFTVRVLDIVWFYFYLLFAAIPHRAVWAGLAPLLVGTFVFIKTGNVSSDDNNNVLMGISVAVGLVVLSILFVLFYLLMILSNLDENQPTGEIQFVVNREGASVVSKDRTEIFRWPEITDIGKNKYFVWIHANDKHYRFIPLSRLNNQITASGLWQQINSYRNAA